MPRYMLDTDTCSYIMKRSHPPVLKRLQTPCPSATSACRSSPRPNCSTASRCRRGARRTPRRWPRSCPYVEVLDFADDAALHYAEIRADLKKRGAMIGANDLFIAAHARALGLTLVTNNTAEFERVKGPGDRELDAATAATLAPRGERVAWRLTPGNPQTGKDVSY